jgi:Tfp pilus assembly ATPase PilU
MLLLEVPQAGKEVVPHLLTVLLPLLLVYHSQNCTTTSRTYGVATKPAEAAAATQFCSRSSIA